jgi:CubicO group peptidase (beta-lactamase class C family)
MIGLAMLAVLAAQGTWPGSGWTTATPAQAGMDAAKLQQARDYALTGGGAGMITRGGKLVLSWGDVAQKFDLKSTTKSFGATALGLAVGDGKVSLSAKAQTYHPSLGVPPDSNTATGWLDDITIKHLATQTAGFDKPGGYTALLFAPGTKWSYSDGGPNWLAECLTLTYKQDLNTLMWNRVFTPIGIPAAELSWRSNAYRPDTIGGVKNREFGSGISASVNALARLGLLHLRGGRWSSGQILPSSYVDLVRKTPAEVKGLPVTLPDSYGDASNHYGLLWWNNADAELPTVPTDAYWTWGLYDSWAIVIPSLDIVASRAGNSLQSTFSGHYGVIRPFLEPIAQSVQAAAPPPPSQPQRIWLAAKNGTLAGKMARSALYGAGSLAADLVYPNLDAYNTSNATQADAVTFSNVLIPAAGTWYLWARMYFPGTTAQPTNDPNSFWVSVDGGTALSVGNLTTKDKTWHWDGNAGALLSLGSLTATEHTIRIWNREARETSTTHLSPRLDVVLLTNDPAYVPRDADAPSFGGGGAGSGGAPYPASSAITGFSWAATSTIVRQATGSDNWPLTWADDGELYGAYGDGNGFDPKVSTKLSLGFAKVAGSPPGTGTNIRSATGEQTGDGQAGKKASGMLMVDGTLYMWTRNAGSGGKESQLAWSADRAKTWTWASWRFAEFGYLAFVNYGQNYAGARDGYVYAVTHDNPSAYTQADRFVLLRVPKAQIRDKAAYQFYSGKDGAGNPTWSSSVGSRAAVFSFPGRCRRSQMSYNAALGRYLWWQMYHEDGVDQRFGGGFGVYDAPEPWGPWTTAYFTTSWDVGPGETGGFPTKWMSADGKTVHLVFSGDDAFSVRKATLTVSGSGGNAPPSVTLTAPAANASFPAGSNITLQATASDSNGSVTKVEFFRNGTLLGSDTTSPYAFTWSNVAAGSYTLTARATDNGGAATTSGGVPITVTSPSNAAPSVTLTAPSNGATFSAGATVTLQATASDSDGSVAKVEFFANGSLLGSDASSPYSYAWINVGSGSYTLTARATDNGGATTTSAGAAITVSGSSGGGPTVTIASVSTGKAYALGTAQGGALYYIDRSYTITSLASGLNGAILVRTANDDKSVTASNHLTLTLGGAATVYVAYDRRGTTAPSWLRDGTWTVTTLSFAVSDAGASPMRVYSKSVSGGSLVLGGNLAGGAVGAGSNYVVLVKAASSGTLGLLAVAQDVADPGLWEHPGDTDGDGLSDEFEVAHGTSPSDADSDGDGMPDESELGPDGRTLWEVQEAESSGGPPAGDSSACGATGAELILVLLPLARRRRRS